MLNTQKVPFVVLRYVHGIILTACICFKSKTTMQVRLHKELSIKHLFRNHGIDLPEAIVHGSKVT